MIAVRARKDIRTVSEAAGTRGTAEIERVDH